MPKNILIFADGLIVAVIEQLDPRMSTDDGIDELGVLAGLSITDRGPGA